MQTHANDLTGNIADCNMQTGNFTIIFPSLNLKEKIRKITDNNDMIVSSCGYEDSNSSSSVMACMHFTQIKNI